MKVSFKNLEVRSTLNGAVEKADLTKIVAEAVYQNAANFNQHKLAHRIYDTEGEVELSDADVKAIKDAIASYKFFVQKPILEALGESFE